MANSIIKKDRIKKKSYIFNATTDAVENCFPLDLKTNSTVVIGIRITNRAGWNFIARNAISGSQYSAYWALTTVSGATLSGDFYFDVLYIET